ncbi:hypothetical protein NQ315_009932 [Exocentrus adspersus]|uniref:CHK kinase-like domain-containing protein n=1 Tax=Exocentrus adspersus TaxID=1586481 RepID=A0AAV8WII8_9CUCU|nr:hypothetical protein NQ315_009932 [Exocentrus adspersus]
MAEAKVKLTDLQAWIGTVMAEEGVTDYHLDVSGNTTDGDGYLGEVTFVKIKAPNKDIHLVVKSAKASEEFRKKTPIKQAYDRETYMYTKVFPVLEQFRKECLHQFPRCYGACAEDRKEALIMEDLKMSGFEVHDRRRPQNLNHALLVFRNYGKYHAVSLGLRLREPVLFQKLTKDMSDVMAMFMTQMKILPNVTKEFETAVDVLRRSGKGALADKYRDVTTKLKQYLVDNGDADSTQSVILHGDCWNNNMMFKYEDDNKTQPTDMRFIDFQLSKVASPVFDLSYYLYTCADKPVLDQFDFLLQAYHSSLSDALEELGLDCEQVLSYDQLKQHWRKYGTYGLALAPMIVKIELFESEEAVDFAESLKKGQGFKNTVDVKLQEQEVYEARLLDVFQHFAEKFL